MPTYVYKFIESGETIEVQQSFADDALTEAVHPETGELRPVKKVFQPVGVTFKGSGFFKTDNRGSKSTMAPGSSASTPDSSGGGSSGDSSGDSSGSDSSGSGSTGSTSNTSPGSGE